ncbi:MAG: hypothetical protein ACLFUS_07950 [Candidatus Sumerlaeia bacterium]
MRKQWLCKIGAGLLAGLMIFAMAACSGSLAKDTSKKKGCDCETKPATQTRALPSPDDNGDTEAVPDPLMLKE